MKRTFRVCAPVPTENVNCTSMMLFATHLSFPPQVLGKEPGLDLGTNCFVWADPPSTWSANTRGRSSPKLLRDGDTFTIIAMFPFLVLKR